MFNTTGQVHFSGIKNEHETIKLLNEWAIYPDTVTHLGGTKQKEDAEAGKQGISIKHKKGLNSGSFDWVNTSKTFPLIADDHFTLLILGLELSEIQKLIFNRTLLT